MPTYVQASGSAQQSERIVRSRRKVLADGELQTAFRLFLAAANAGFVPAFEIVGQFYDHGTGVKAN